MRIASVCLSLTVKQVCTVNLSPLALPFPLERETHRERERQREWTKTKRERGGKRDSWCFEPSQLQRIASGREKMDWFEVVNTFYLKNDISNSRSIAFRVTKQLYEIKWRTALFLFFLHMYKYSNQFKAHLTNIHHNNFVSSCSSECIITILLKLLQRWQWHTYHHIPCHTQKTDRCQMMKANISNMIGRRSNRGSRMQLPL